MSDIDPVDAELDLGDGHTLRFVGWYPDRGLNPQYADIPDEPRYAATITHLDPHGESCTGGITFAGDVATRLAVADRALWTVEQWDPLTISPSVLCFCGDHGFIRDGRWVRA